MKFKIVEDNLVISRSGNWMVDAPDEHDGEFDQGLFKEEQAEHCKLYRQNYNGEWVCTFEHKPSPDEDVWYCPNDMEECPAGLWDGTESEYWTRQDWKNFNMQLLPFYKMEIWRKI